MTNQFYYDIIISESEENTIEEKYYQLLNEKNEAERLLAEKQSKPFCADYTELVYRVVDAKSNFEKYCVEVLEALMEQNADILKNLKKNP